MEGLLNSCVVMTEILWNFSVKDRKYFQFSQKIPSLTFGISLLNAHFLQLEL